MQPTFFEVTTAVAFELFRRAGVDVAVLEVGLGGRLDATNVLAPPHLVATAITSIAFDHQRYLGATLAGDRLEKAGIIKPGVPIVVGAARAEAAAASSESPASAAPKSSGHPRPMAPAWPSVCEGAHQSANAAVAVRLLEILDATASASQLMRLRPGSPIRSGPAGSNCAGWPTGASCCSTPPTTRPAPRRSRLIS